MDAKKRVCTVLLITMIMLVWLRPPNMFVMRDPNEYSIMWEIKNMIQGILNHGSCSGHAPVSSNLTSMKPNRVVLGPNLTSCHESITEWNLPANCCPPKSVSEQPFIDFKFPDPSALVRVRRPAHQVDKEYIAKYNKAVSIMKSLPYNDPRNFIRQASFHCLYCTGSYNQKHSNSLMKIHRSWMFFPWHRMVLYFHERILGSLIGDDSFALPFWNWDNPDGMVIPNMYMNGSLFDKERDSSHLPPHVTDNNYNIVESGLGPEDQIASNVALMYHQMVSGAKKSELFMGCPYKAGEDGFCDGPGTIEAAPHNPLHTWVGNPSNTQRENLGAFYAAARDPIFYAHHSNIDRLWEVWKELRGNKTPEIIDPDWLDSYFYFHDENSQLVRIKIRDVLDVTKLKYTYQRVENPWLNSRPKPSISPQVARQILKMRDTNQIDLPLSNNSFGPDIGLKGRPLDTTIRVRVHRPKIHRTMKEKEDEEEVLVVYGIDVKKDMYVKFDVYVNAVDEMNIGPESREFAGTFVKMRKGVRLVMKDQDDVGVNKKKTKLKLGISELLEDLEADGEESIWVTLVPRGGTGVNTTIDGIRIEYLQ